MPTLGLDIPSFTFPGVPDAALFERIAAIAGSAEDAGYDAVWVMDHVHQVIRWQPPSDPMLEAYTLLGGLAARTRRVELGTLVTGVTYRNPAHLAKIVTTLDLVSAGRAVLGIGAGWYEPEHAAYGFPFPPPGERLDRLEEALRICRAMFTEEAPSFAGRHYRIDGALNVPRPVRPGGPPIVVGGAGEKRTLALAARHADAVNFPTAVRLGELPRKLEAVARHCEQTGRDPATLRKTALQPVLIGATGATAERAGRAFRDRVGMDAATFREAVIAGDQEHVVDRLGAYLAAGLDGIVVFFPDLADLDQIPLLGEAFRRSFG